MCGHGAVLLDFWPHLLDGVKTKTKTRVEIAGDKDGSCCLFKDYAQDEHNLAAPFLNMRPTFCVSTSHSLSKRSQLCKWPSLQASSQVGVYIHPTHSVSYVFKKI